MLRVLEFYSSHLLCAITSIGAFHAKYKLAAEKRGMLYLANAQYASATISAILEYTACGWNFSVEPGVEIGTLQLNNASDPTTDALVLIFDHDSPDLANDLSESRQNAFRHLSWIYTEGHTSYMRYVSRLAWQIFSASQIEHECLAADVAHRTEDDRIAPHLAEKLLKRWHARGDVNDDIEEIARDWYNMEIRHTQCFTWS